MWGHSKADPTGCLMNYAGHWEKINQQYAASRETPQQEMLCLSDQWGMLGSDEQLGVTAPQTSNSYKDMKDCWSLSAEKNAHQIICNTVLHRQKIVGEPLCKLHSFWGIQAVVGVGFCEGNWFYPPRGDSVFENFLGTKDKQDLFSWIDQGVIIGQPGFLYDL